MSELTDLRARILASPGSFHLLESDAHLPFPDGSIAAGQARLRKMWESVEDLTHALRGEGLTLEEADEMARQDRINFDLLIAENDRREDRDRRARNRDNDLEEAA
ncbi:hypothetical protein [Tabrizicola sp.]|uniref:hypothetical protein n=1 Tax=Tabrizicola sp. TaxID=2005166 RepID=UPI0027337552|nr:hypothetical protein [Tabrizicola sp.]MDP3196135.1 hypothetical protein [Tabrizicola sp.]